MSDWDQQASTGASNFIFRHSASPTVAATLDMKITGTGADIRISTRGSPKLTEKSYYALKTLSFDIVHSQPY